jgi:hypothetical protein
MLVAANWALAIQESFAQPFETSEMGLIAIRPDADGAGPSHIFWLQDDKFAVVDPLKSQILIYREGDLRAAFTKKIPFGFDPYRLVRGPSDVAIVDETEKQVLRVPRELTSDRPLPGVEVVTSRNVDFQPTKAKRHNGARITLLPANKRPLEVVATGQSPYLASARELESDREGNRYVLWKETWCESPIKVQVFVGRYDRAGQLNALVNLPLEKMKKVGFDYATVSPSGRLFTIAQDQPSQFHVKIFDFKDMHRPTASTTSRFPRRNDLQTTEPCMPGRLETDEPMSSTAVEVEELGPTQIADTSEAPEDVPPSKFPRTDRPGILKRAAAFTTLKWTLNESNVRPPCR